MKKVLSAASICAFSLAGAARAEATPSGLETGLKLDLAACLLAAVQEPAAKPAQSGADGPGFGDFVKGQKTQWYVTVGAGGAADGDSDTHFDGFVAFSTFIGRQLEIQLEGSGWYFDQDPDSTAGAGFAINLRWHFWHGAYGGGEGNDWTVYADAGIGMIFSGDDVPDGGSSVNFAPRAGVGFTARLGESTSRLVGGVRWHHMSNARSNGDSDNPDFNAPLFYLGIEWPL